MINIKKISVSSRLFLDIKCSKVRRDGRGEVRMVHVLVGRKVSLLLGHDATFFLKGRVLDNSTRHYIH